MLDLGILILRLGLGIMFFAHGLQIAFGKLGGPGPEGFSKMLSGLGFSPAIFWAYLAAYTTLIGGLCLFAGLFTRVASFALLIFITVAAVKVHIAKGFFIMSGGFEYNFVIACGCLALLLLGAGKFSISDKF
ncbi:MAG: DoxX family protein [bacterium]